jgi:hypothetical protein
MHQWHFAFIAVKLGQKDTEKTNMDIKNIFQYPCFH